MGKVPVRLESNHSLSIASTPVSSRGVYTSREYRDRIWASCPVTSFATVLDETTRLLEATPQRNSRSARDNSKLSRGDTEPAFSLECPDAFLAASDFRRTDSPKLIKVSLNYRN